MTKLKPLINDEIISYIFFGVLTTIVNILVYFFLAKICGIQYIISNILAWFISIVFAYITNKKYVFYSENKNILVEFTLFVSGRLLSGVLDSLLLYIFVELLVVNDLISKIIIGIIVIIINYIYSKIIVFKNR